jgi:glutamyl-tRNA synthetase
MRDHTVAFPQNHSSAPTPQEVDSTRRVTRLAPSPTGALHLGNARTFLINWALARKNSWKIVFRIEDLDGPRIKPGADLKAIQDLNWLGIDWDQGPFYQRVDLEIYRQALAALGKAGLAYPCTCTRREIMNALSAPHAEDHEIPYPGTCRPDAAKPTINMHAQDNRHDDETADTAWRLRVPMGEQAKVAFTDQIAGQQFVDVQEQSGDFVIWTKAGLPSYQLAVVIDDLRQGITEVVRGDDLLSSTGRQILLYQLRELLTKQTPPAMPAGSDDRYQRDAITPHWWHLPMVLGPDGRRLAKRHGDSRVAWYREQGVAAERIIGLLASWSGICQTPEPMDAQTFANEFDIKNLPPSAVTFTPEMHEWLLA